MFLIPCIGAFLFFAMLQRTCSTPLALSAPSTASNTSPIYPPIPIASFEETRRQGLEFFHRTYPNASLFRVQAVLFHGQHSTHPENYDAMSLGAVISPYQIGFAFFYSDEWRGLKLYNSTTATTFKLINEVNIHVTLAQALTVVTAQPEWHDKITQMILFNQGAPPGAPEDQAYYVFKIEGSDPEGRRLQGPCVGARDGLLYPPLRPDSGSNNGLDSLLDLTDLTNVDAGAAPVTSSKKK